MKKQLSATKRILVVIGALAAILLIVSVVLILDAQPNAAGIPKSLLRKGSFPVYSVGRGKSWKVNPVKTRYDEKNNVLTQTFDRDDNSVTMTEQMTPSVFDDIPRYYPTLLDKLHQYGELQTQLGAVTLTRPDELKGGQSAVANIHGTLMFAHPKKDLTSDDWRDFYNSLELVQ